MKKEDSFQFLRQSVPNDPTIGQPEVNLFTKVFPESGYTLSVRPICLERHIGIMHRWANLPYSANFWQMQGDRESLYHHYLQMLRGDKSRIFFLYMEGLPVAQLEVYPAADDEVGRHYKSGRNDFGIHLLMAPYRELLAGTGKKLTGISHDALMTVLCFLFGFPSVDVVVAEPDKNNGPACTLAEKAGFKFMSEIEMSYKTANLYTYCKEDFLKDMALLPS